MATIFTISTATFSTLIFFLCFASPSMPYHRYRGAVAANGHECAAIGTSILRKGGNAVDAAIATLFCEGVSVPESCGIGGGFLMTIYYNGNESRRRRGVYSLVARETAPKASHEDMFGHNSRLSTHGGLAVAIPGEVRGYWEAYKRFGGRVKWSDLVKPTIDLCRRGILVTPYLEKVFKAHFDVLYQDEYLREAFINPITNDTYKEGNFIKRLRLAKTLEIIANDGADGLYNGVLTRDFINDIKNKGGIITSEDLNNYRATWSDPIKIKLPFNQTLFSSPLPGSGAILALIMNILNGFIDYSKPESITNWQRMIEAFKFAYAKRTELGDLDLTELLNQMTSREFADAIRENISDTQTFQDVQHYGANMTQSEDHGTAHICVLGRTGDAVAVTTTINLVFGAGFMSPSTGIILNNQMDDFSSSSFSSYYNIPPSPVNFIAPGKRPLSSMVPSIVMDDYGNVKLIVGAAGGTRITSSVAQVIVRNLWFNQSIIDAVDHARVHHQLFPMVLDLELPFENDTRFVEALKEIGHKVTFSELNGFSAVTAISTKEGVVRATSDNKRRPGSTSLI